MNEEEIVRRAQMAIKRFDSLQIVGSGWSGNSRQGFQFNPESGRAGFAGGSTPTPGASGACCPASGDCFIATQSICEAGGGAYQGDDTTCDTDPCGCGCTVRATFHDIIFDCPCSDDGHGQSFILTDVNLDGRSIDEPLRPDFIGCFDCVWQFGTWSVPYPLHADRWEFNNTCSGSPSSAADIIVALSVRRLGGIYYVFGTVSTGVGSAVVFIGNSSDPTNIPNDAFCNPTPIGWTDPCTSETLIGASHGGHISLEFPTDVTCGACCYSGFSGTCFSTTPATCASIGGTYIGDGTPCTPDPC